MPGLSDYVFGPPGIHQDPFDSCDLAGKREAQMVMAGAITELLERTGLIAGLAQLQPSGHLQERPEQIQDMGRTPE